MCAPPRATSGSQPETAGACACARRAASGLGFKCWVPGERSVALIGQDSRQLCVLQATPPHARAPALCPHPPCAMLRHGIVSSMPLQGHADTRGLHALLRQGDVLAVSPYESHLDERLFGADAGAYNPERPALRLGGGSVPGVGGLPGLVFGGGRYRRASASLSLLQMGEVCSWRHMVVCKDQRDSLGQQSASLVCCVASSGIALIKPYTTTLYG